MENRKVNPEKKAKGEIENEEQDKEPRVILGLHEKSLDKAGRTLPARQ
ncbi:hypothetical protein [Chryseobacterium sp. G0162]|nr:hypothetical protein [Chryseobacterium sp. G0162]